MSCICSTLDDPRSERNLWYDGSESHITGCPEKQKEWGEAARRNRKMTKTLSTTVLSKLMKLRKKPNELTLDASEAQWLATYIDLLGKTLENTSNLQAKRRALFSGEGMSQRGGRANALYAAERKERDIQMQLSAHLSLPDPRHELLEKLNAK